jgi:hypothetical protein
MNIEKGVEAIRETIQDSLQKKKGALIGRNGTIELETLLFRLYGSSPQQGYPQHITRRLGLHAGIWPIDKTSVDRWVFLLIEAIRLSDVLVAGWYEPLKSPEEKLLDTTNTLAPRIPLRSLEPYYVAPELRWTHLLAGHRVAVISSFAETMEEQINHREEVWPIQTDSLLPANVEWIFIRTGYSPMLAKGSATWPSPIGSWEMAVSSVVRKVVESKSSFALIGCGGLGMLIAAELKKQGVIAIVLGGAIQVLFGIKGMRWATHSVISHFWNEAWVFPKQTEIPKGASLIEGGCYWGKIETADV